MRYVAYSKKGFSVIEILFVAAVVTIALVALIQLYSFSLKISSQTKRSTEAVSLAVGTMEAVRNIRDESWDSISTLITMGADYYPAYSGVPSMWSLVSGGETVSEFTRKVVFNDVNRDINDDIVEGGGTNDPNTKKVIVTVSWTEGARSREVKLATYLTNWR